jgi:hypothetical protein
MVPTIRRPDAELLTVADAVRLDALVEAEVRRFVLWPAVRRRVIVGHQLQ